jgi:hypothetical protein
MSSPNDENIASGPAVGVQRSCSASCRTCRHWSEQDLGYGVCQSAGTRDLIRILGGYMLCNAAFGCVMHEPNS